VILSALLTTHDTTLADLAEDWLAEGAQMFSIWERGRMLAGWPAAATSIDATLLAPIQIGRQVLGELRVAITAVGTAQHRLHTQACMLARMVRLEDETQHLASELIDAQDQLLALYDLTQTTRSHLGIPETLRALAGEAARLIRTAGAVMLLPPTVVHYPAQLIETPALMHVMNEVQSSGNELVLNQKDSSALPEGLDNLCLIPIWVRGKICAALGLLNKLDGPFIAPDLKLARAIAEHAGSQIEHALLYQESLAQAVMQTEMQLARDVQTRLLPQHRPLVRGADIFADSRPALQVGGDFYDFVQLPGQPLCLMLGDVAGKGISAALIMGMVHAITRSAAKFVPGVTPAAVLSRANEHLYEDFTTLDSFATVFVAQYDPIAHSLCYANAGHAPVIYCPAGGPARLIEGDGVPVGVLPVSLCENYAMPFRPGDLLVVATDGFNEAASPSGELYGYERLCRLVEQLADQPAQAIGRALYEAVEIFAAGQLRSDDQTLIVLKGAAL
jgi:sigma-B regulation protein RsbU (phosphoserine phosphatase)